MVNLISSICINIHQRAIGFTYFTGLLVALLIQGYKTGVNLLVRRIPDAIVQQFNVMVIDKKHKETWSGSMFHNIFGRCHTEFFEEAFIKIGKVIETVCVGCFFDVASFFGEEICSSFQPDGPDKMAG